VDFHRGVPLPAASIRLYTQKHVHIYPFISVLYYCAKISTFKSGVVFHSLMIKTAFVGKIPGISKSVFNDKSSGLKNHDLAISLTHLSARQCL